jgi:hypothetical protein
VVIIELIRHSPWVGTQSNDVGSVSWKSYNDSQHDGGSFSTPSSIDGPIQILLDELIQGDISIMDVEVDSILFRPLAGQDRC